MEKYLKVKFTEDELLSLSREAYMQNKTVNHLVHDAALGCKTDLSPVYAAFEVSNALSEIRDALNKIIIRETEADVRLFEDDVIELDWRMNEVEVAVAGYLRSVGREM